MIGTAKLSALVLAATIGVTGLAGAASAADYRGLPHFQMQRMDHGPSDYWRLRHRHFRHEFFRMPPPPPYGYYLPPPPQPGYLPPPPYGYRG